jgi:hypothetical protein
MLTWNLKGGGTMPYIGTLFSAQPFRLETNASLRGAVTISWLKQGGIIDIELLPGTIPPHDHAIPRRANRVRFEVAPGIGSSILFKLAQGGAVVEETVFMGDTQFIFDVG